MYIIYSILFFVCNLFIYSKADISDLRACADPQCKELIAIGRTIQLYIPKEKGVLSFNADEVVSIYSKEAGSNTELWGVKINGKSGYIPKKFVREEKVYIHKLKHLVPTSNKSSDEPYEPNSDTNQENTISDNSDSKADIEISSSNVDKDSNSQKTFADEVVLTSEDAELAALKALSFKGEKKTIESSLIDDNKNKKVETLYKQESAIPITDKIESPSSVDNGEQFEVPIEKKEFQTFVDKKEGSQVHIDNKLESHIEGSQYTIDTEIKLPFPVDTKEESRVSTDDKLESQAVLDKEESLIAVDGKEGFQVPNINKEIVTNELQSSDEKVLELETLNILENKEREQLNLKPLNKGSNIEEEVGNSEGNGNEGEDNGSEYIGDLSSEHNKKEPLDSGSTQSTSTDIPELSLVEEENGKESETNSLSSVTSNSVTSESVTEIKVNKISKEGEKIDNNLSSDNQLPKPTPSQIQVVDGTTIHLDESDTYQSSIVSELKDITYSNLESSSDKQDNSNIQSTTPTPRLPDSNFLTQPPLIVKNIKIATESMPPLKNSEIVTPPIDSVTSVLHHKKSLSASYSQNEDVGRVDTDNLSPNEQEVKEEVDLEFSTVKPESVLEHNIKKYSHIDAESNIEINDNSHSDNLNNEAETSGEINNILSDKADQIESSDNVEISDSLYSNDPVNVHDSSKPSVENHEEYKNEISGDESLDSLQNEVNLHSIRKRNVKDDEKIEENDEYSDSISSSISSFFSHESKSEEENPKQETQNELQEEHSQKSILESSDLGEASPDNSNSTSDFTVRSIPFIDPFSEPEVPKNFPDILQSVDVETNDISNADKPEDLDFSSSIKKKLLHVSEAVLSEGMSLAVEGELADPHLSKGTVTFLLVVAVTIIFLYVSHLCFVKWSRESPLLENLNKLDRNHRVLAEENKNLKRQLSDSNGQIKSAMATDPIELQNLKRHLEETQKRLMGESEDLRERNQQLEAELEASTANEVELHRMLDELLANQKDTTNFEDSVNSLQSMLDSQRERVENLTSDLALKTRLNEELRNELKAGKSKLSKLEYQIEQLMLSLEEANTLKQDLVKKLASEEENSLLLREMNSTLRQEASKTSKESESHYQEVQKLLKDIRKLKQSLHTKETECQISKECLKKLQIFSDSGGNDVLNKLSEIFNFIEDKTQVERVQYENSYMQMELDEKDNIISSLSEELKRSKSENVSVRSTSERLQKEKNDAESKLKVLSQYYEEREADLKKALESQEDLRQSAEGSANLVSNRIQTYELELASRKSLIESLKNELEEQKQSHKIQLANEEKKLHETWLSARAAERRQEELRQENTQLRQSLTQLQRDADTKTVFNKPPPKRVDANGSISSPIPVENDIGAPLPPGIPPLDMDGTMPHLPPPPMMFPPPPGLPPLPPRMFGPLPPPHHHPPLPDRRLPPAGRIASPPGYDRRSYSPESDRSRYSDHRYSPGPSSTFSSNNQRGSSPDRRSDHMRRNIRRGTRRSPSLERHSPRERWYNQSPTGAHPKNHRTPPLDYYDSAPTQERRRGNPNKGNKTSTPIGPNDR